MERRISESDDSFVIYCQLNGVKPIPQDTVILPVATTVKPLRKNIPTLPIVHSMIHYEDSLLEYYTDGQKNIVRDLRLGKYKIVACIDLHNHTQDMAMNKLELFIIDRETRANTCLKVIHGKGLNSQSNQGVLKHLVRRYLERHERVLAYSNGGNSNGGDGVTLIKLKSMFKKD